MCGCLKNEWTNTNEFGDNKNQAKCRDAKKYQGCRPKKVRRGSVSYTPTKTKYLITAIFWHL